MSRKKYYDEIVGKRCSFWVMSRFLNLFAEDQWALWLKVDKWKIEYSLGFWETQPGNGGVG